ncbi:MAG TPA: hypothetical protein VJV78_22085 [Polyangiales bacterium]|nr:hypothetical protein [Polyangiales bacterium]
MKDFARASGRLRQLPLLARVTYSIFIAFTLLALVESAWLGADMLGADLTHFDEYYAGAPAAPHDQPSAPAATPSGGPSIELPSDMPAAAASEPIPLRKLLEVTHFHLFSMPVYLMILSHLFMLCGWSNRAKLSWIAVGTLAVAAHMAAPWLARGGGAAARAFYAGSGALLGISFGLMGALPLFAMWGPDKRRNSVPDT